MTTTSTIDTHTYRTPPGIEIVTCENAPARLPGRGHGQSHPTHLLAARDDGEYLFVGLRGGNGLPDSDLDPEPTRLHLTPGDICFYDAQHTPALDFPERFRATVFLVPGELLGLTEPDVRRIVRTPVDRASRLGALLSPLLSDLARTEAEAGPPVGDMLAWNAVNLLATLATEHLGARAPGAQGTQPPVLARIMQYVELHLTDPDLSPEVIARAHHISVRYLHKLFKDEGATVGRWILRRRLEECRRDLMRHGRGSRTIAAVAGRWGFLSATHFSRVFRAAYGMSPREWRDTVGRPRVSPPRAPR
ncbi:helix-turn-helix domain-containing protein [Streptomyces sp. NBC_01275]|uniref:helix-turn-helix domain-containing protein n=1 Tax=Streptomyces sp. NBC_01275 TaxID=2903807 RepID=UPI00225B42C6|nr:helix-turn-helix domain-containing protein [Streptomyces sp. NBC_01275]MCX4760245.1 helix-turn-helix domain-containing protein [Streptomyces sp. NBC_01275]